MDLHDFLSLLVLSNVCFLLSFVPSILPPIHTSSLVMLPSAPLAFKMPSEYRTLQTLFPHFNCCLSDSKYKGPFCFHNVDYVSNLQIKRSLAIIDRFSNYVFSCTYTNVYLWKSSMQLLTLNITIAVSVVWLDVKEKIFWIEELNFVSKDVTCSHWRHSSWAFLRKNTGIVPCHWKPSERNCN